MEIVLPGTAKEFDSLFRQAYTNGKPTYYRLSEYTNDTDCDVIFGKANIIKKGELATVIAVGTTLNIVLEATKDLDVTVLYYTSISPFDTQVLQENCDSGKILLCEPYYRGVLSTEIMDAMFPKQIILDCVGVPLNFLTNYGKKEEHDQAIGLTAVDVKEKLDNLLSISI